MCWSKSETGSKTPFESDFEQGKKESLSCYSCK